MNSNQTQLISEYKKKRVVRVFISSTFRDMQAERDYLVKFIFPQLRKLCEARGVIWGEVDLRWGITDEQSAEGKVLPICLEEIKRCRPYFIGLLGERYGWVPESIPEELLEMEPWLSEQFKRRKSVTELEILHGVLRNPEMAGHAYFYFRNPNYVNSVAEDKNKNFVTENAENAEKLMNLKESIRHSGFPVRENYPNPEALGELVLKDITVVIDQLYPEGSQPDPLDREAKDHEDYARSRAQVYIGRDEYFQSLNEHAAGQGNHPLVILGDSGSGKSALLANWAIRYRQDHPDTLLIQHYISASPYGADWVAMLKRIMGEFKRRFNIQQEIPDAPDKLRTAFVNWLHMAAAKGRVILILDALNQLEDRDGAPDLVWLPPVTPSNIRLVLSTLPGRPLYELKNRSRIDMLVQPFNHVEIKTFIVKYFAQFTKTLSNVRAELIASTRQTDNPLYLQALLEELRVFGIYEKLDERIDHYLKARSIPDLYQRILERYEKDYERDRQGLVREVMSLIWAARRGLSELELLDMLGSGGSPLPKAIWSPLYLAAERSFVNRSGLIGFSHDYFRQAVKNKYLPTDKEQHAAHIKLANYFERQNQNTRKIDELAWQFAEANSWKRLYVLLSDIKYLLNSWHLNNSDAMIFWQKLESYSRYRMIDAYEPIFKEGEKYGDFIWIITNLFGNAGHLEETIHLWKHLLSSIRHTGDLGKLQGVLGHLGLALFDNGDMDGAMQAFKEEEKVCLQMGNIDGAFGLQASLGNQAEVFSFRGDLVSALELFKRQEEICSSIGNRDGLQNAIGNQGSILCEQGNYNEAMDLYKKQEEVCKETGDILNQHYALSRQATVNLLHGNLDRALALFKKSEVVFREFGNKRYLFENLHHQGILFFQNGDMKGSTALFNEAVTICEKFGRKDYLFNLLEVKGELYRAAGNLNDAMEIYKEIERLCRKLGEKINLRKSLLNQAKLLYVFGELDKAMELSLEGETICKTIGNQAGFAEFIGIQAMILQIQGMLPEAFKLRKKEENICREIGNKNGIAGSLGGQASIFSDQGQLTEAMKLHKAEETIFREIGNKTGISQSLGSQALILKAQGDLDQAMKYHKEEMLICKELNNRDGVARSLGNQAIILKDIGDMDEALRLHQEEEKIAKELGYKERIQVSLGNQAVIFAIRGDFNEAMRLNKEKEIICREIGNRNSLATSLGNQANIYYERGEIIEAMRLYKEEELIRRELENPERLARALYNQAVAKDSMGLRQEALLLAEESFMLATLHELDLRIGIIAFLDYLREKDK